MTTAAYNAGAILLVGSSKADTLLAGAMTHEKLSCHMHAGT
jgi:hypothetical protein